MDSLPTYPTLYKIGNSKNKILEWKLQIIKNPTGNGYNILTIYGEQNGKLMEKIANIPIGKAGRTVIEQVTQEANRRFQNKIKKENYLEEINHNSTIKMRPMLAQTFLPELYQTKTRSYKMEFPLYVQPKLDGIRCISEFIPGSRKIKMISRKGTEFNNFKDIQDNLFYAIENKFTSNIFIDGELYSDELSFEKISGLVRSQTLTNDEKQLLKKINYHIYDIFIPEYPLLGYDERHKILLDLFDNNNTNTICKLVITEIANTIDEIKPLHQKYIEQGYEGIMLRDKKGPYEMDKRSKYLQKYKTFLEEEFEIIGYTDEDKMIIFECKTSENKHFSVRPRGTFETRKEMFAKGDSYIGKFLTVIFQEYTELNIPRFPVGKTVRDYE
jgi:ATP-dependent DNA ligase